MSGLIALSNPDCLDPLDPEIHQSRVGVEVKWCCFKADVGVQGNEAADLLSKSVSELYVVSTYVDLPPSLVKHYLRQEIMHTWHNLWEG